MNKFTKTMIATAVSGLIAGPASAVDFAVYATQAGASIKASGGKCDTFKLKNLDMVLEVGPTIAGGPNTGDWFSEFFTFNQAIDGEGPLIAAKPGKNFTMDLDEDGYLALLDFMEGYIFEGCQNPDFLQAGTTITKFNTKTSKNGSKATLKFRAEGTYFDFDSETDRKVNVSVDAKLDSVD